MEYPEKGLEVKVSPREGYAGTFFFIPVGRADRRLVLHFCAFFALWAPFQPRGFMRPPGPLFVPWSLVEVFDFLDGFSLSPPSVGRS